MFPLDLYIAIHVDANCTGKQQKQQDDSKDTSTSNNDKNDNNDEMKEKQQQKQEKEHNTSPPLSYLVHCTLFVSNMHQMEDYGRNVCFSKFRQFILGPFNLICINHIWSANQIPSKFQRICVPMLTIRQEITILIHRQYETGPFASLLEFIRLENSHQLPFPIFFSKFSTCLFWLTGLLYTEDKCMEYFWTDEIGLPSLKQFFEKNQERWENEQFIEDSRLSSRKVVHRRQKKLETEILDESQTCPVAKLRQSSWKVYLIRIAEAFLNHNRRDDWNRHEHLRRSVLALCSYECQLDCFTNKQLQCIDHRHFPMSTYKKNEPECEQEEEENEDYEKLVRFNVCSHSIVQGLAYSINKPNVSSESKNVRTDYVRSWQDVCLQLCIVDRIKLPLPTPSNGWPIYVRQSKKCNHLEFLECGTPMETRIAKAQLLHAQQERAKELYKAEITTSLLPHPSARPLQDVAHSDVAEFLWHWFLYQNSPYHRRKYGYHFQN